MQGTKAMVGGLILLVAGGCAMDGSDPTLEGRTAGVRDAVPQGIAAAYGGREIPVERIELRGQVAALTALGSAQGEVFVGELDDEGETSTWMFTEFVGPAQEAGLVQVAVNLPLEALQRAREEGRVVFPEDQLPPVVMTSGANLWDSIEPARLEVEVSEGSEPGTERLDIYIWGDLVTLQLGEGATEAALDVEGEQPVTSCSVGFEYDPSQIFGEAEAS